jgi:hypothetical protein
MPVQLTFDFGLPFIFIIYQPAAKPARPSWALNTWQLRLFK